MARKLPFRKITILFKSGHSVRIKARNLETTYNGDNLQKISWDEMKPRQVFLSVTDIESIWVK